MTHLRYLLPFVQVVKCGGFSAAAERLGVTTPAISRSVAQLERGLGVRLFNRTTRQLHLTSEGRDFFEKINPLIEGINSAAENAKATMEDPKGLVRVAVGATFGRYYLIPVIADFFQQYPDVRLALDLDDDPKGSPEREFDVEIRHGQGNQTSFVSRRLFFEFPVILIASPLYLTRRGVPRSIDDLSHHDCISAGATSRNLANWKLTPIHEQDKAVARKKDGTFTPIPKGRLTVAGQYDSGLIAALHGIGIAPSALPAALPFLESGQLKVVLPDYRIKNVSSADNQMYIQYPHREHLPPKVRVFVEYLLAKFHSSENAAEDDIRAYAA